MRREDGIELLPKHFRVDISLVDGFEALVQEVGGRDGRNGRGEVGDSTPGRPSCSNDAKVLIGLACGSAEEFAIEWRVDVRVDCSRILRLK